MAHEIHPSSEILSGSPETQSSLSSPDVNRPIQYLGSKLRVLPLLQEIISLGQREDGVVWDAFTGSSVVAQALAESGNTVAASDMLTSSVTFAKAALGIDKVDNEETECHLRGILRDSHNESTLLDWKPFLEVEEEYINAGDGAGLLSAYLNLPQRWKKTPIEGAATPNLRDAFDAVERAALRGQKEFTGLFSSTYAGTYFGLKQSLRLEEIRSSIENLSVTGIISPWTTHVALTALCTAASKAVFSAGKHFAQPHRVREGKDLTFHSQRVLTDRSVNIDTAFELAFREVVRTSRPAGEGHRALIMGANEATISGLREQEVHTVYADPPYTAQQYSRFYHVLETLISATPPNLQLINGTATAGLYPIDRYKSAYCSRVQAPAAFKHLIGTTAASGARLVLSYSGSAKSSTGNARTVSMEWLTDQVRESYGPRNVTVERMQIRYRQFNNSSAEVAGRDDPEYVIIGEP